MQSSFPSSSKDRAKAITRTRLVVSATVEAPGQGPIPLKVLVDTGAEVNLIRRGLLPDRCFRATNKPIRFVAANRTTVPGGRYEVDAVLCFAGVEPDSGVKYEMPLEISCYEAEVHVDMIVSYAWLSSVQADVIPRKHGLMFHKVGQEEKASRVVWVSGAKDAAYSFGAPSSVFAVRQEPLEPEAERLAIRGTVMDDICTQVGLRPTLDCFASDMDSRCVRHITKEQDALKMEWPRDEVVWLNPPWRLWPQVVEKLCQSKGAAIALFPAWNRPWVQKLLGMAAKRVYIEKGSKVFEVDRKLCPVTWSGMWVVRIDKGPRGSGKVDDPMKKCIFYPSWKSFRTETDAEDRVDATLSMRFRPSQEPSAVTGVSGKGVPRPDARDAKEMTQQQYFQGSGRKVTVAEVEVRADHGKQVERTGVTEGRRMLDLFSGTGSVGRVFASEGYEVVSVDWAERFKPTIVVDVLQWDYKSAFRPGHFDVVFCTPPCEHFSRARTTAPRDLELADSLVRKSLEIIEYLKPRRWFLENPRTGLLPQREYMKDIPYVDADYCQYSDWGYQKPTRIWGDPMIRNLESRVCDGENCLNLVQRPNGYKGHRQMLGGNEMKASRNQKYRVPEKLVRYLAGLPEWEDRAMLINFVQMMRFDPLPEKTVRWLPEPEEVEAWAEHIAELGEMEHFINGVVIANRPLQGELVERLRAKAMEEYQGRVFSTKAVRDPPVRGPFGEASITLKPGVTPKKQRPFQMHGERLEAWKKLIDQLIADGKIEEGVSEWNSPSFPVAKKESGKWRLVDDFRALNDATVTDAHPMPLIQPILNKQGKCKVWSVLDMKDGYHQIPLKKEDRHLTCMSTPRGTYQWKVLVMGLKNGGAIFQRVMEWMLKDLECADPYIDDVIIGSMGDTLEEAIVQHEKDLGSVLERLAKWQMVVDPGKAHLYMEEVEFCGHVLSAGRRRPAPGKLLSIQKWGLPQTVTELRGFLGLTNYYSEYVDRYAEFAGPLMSKLQLNRIDGKKGSKKRLEWRQAEIVAFEKLKELLAKRLELFIIDPDRPFVLRADASDRAIGAVLEQEREVEPGAKPVRVPVGFFSRKLGKNQLNWTPREKETYAIVAALRKWSGWIGLQPVVVTTDHKSLEDWVVEKMDTPSGPAGRRARWHETLSKFDLTVQYVPGANNVVADAMSRFAYPACKAFQDVSFHGSAEAREEVKRIIEEELEEGRMVGTVIKQRPHREFDCCYIAGPLRRVVREQLCAPVLCESIEMEVSVITSWYQLEEERTEPRGRQAELGGSVSVTQVVTDDPGEETLASGCMELDANPDMIVEGGTRAGGRTEHPRR